MQQTPAKPLYAWRGRNIAVGGYARRPWRKMRLQQCLRSERGVCCVARDRCGSRSCNHVFRRVAEESGAEQCCLLWDQRRAKTRFGMARARGFRHDADGATPPQSKCHTFWPAYLAVRRGSHTVSFRSRLQKNAACLDVSGREVVKPGCRIFFLRTPNKVTGPLSFRNDGSMTTRLDPYQPNVSARVWRGRP